jgi:hypothetical protein
MSFSEDGVVSDTQSVDFGIREITSELTTNGSRLFRINGKPILIRGAGWSPDMLLRNDANRLRDQISLVRDMNLNTIRLEGKLETEDFFRLTDREGILVMGALERLDPARSRHRQSFAARPDAASPLSRQPVGVAQWQRQRASRER